MKKQEISKVWRWLLVILLLAADVYSQVSTAEYNSLLSQAESLAAEGRVAEEIAVLQKAHGARPDPSILGRIGVAQMANGQFTEAEQSLRLALAQGGELSFDLRHNHGGGGGCIGHLTISSDHLSWAGYQSKESFSIKPAEVQKLEWFESAYSADIRKSGAGAIPEFKLNAAGKTWRYEYLLYGRTAPRYETLKDGFILYRSSDLSNADTATRLIISLAPLAASKDDLSAILQKPGSLDSKQIEIQAGMTREAVVKALGDPQKSIVFGTKTILKYADVTITLEDNKVVEVKAN